jgi:hypothetical protein
MQQTLRQFLTASVFAAAAVAIGGALLYGSTVHASFERQRTADIEREDGEVCASLGMTSASGRLACTEALTRVRRQHEERLSRESIL